MDESLRQEIADMMDTAVRAFGPQGWDDAIDGLARLAAWFLQYADSFRVDGIMNFLEDVSVEGDERERQQARMELLRSVFLQMPSVARLLITEMANRAKQELPQPAGGRPRAVPQERVQAVCSFIGRLFAQGVSLRIAKERAARQFGISLRTVERIWTGRGKSSTPELNLHELVNSFFVQKGAFVSARTDSENTTSPEGDGPNERHRNV